MHTHVPSGYLALDITCSCHYSLHNLSWKVFSDLQPKGEQNLQSALKA